MLNTLLLASVFNAVTMLIVSFPFLLSRRNNGKTLRRIQDISKKKNRKTRYPLLACKASWVPHIFRPTSLNGLDSVMYLNSGGVTNTLLRGGGGGREWGCGHIPTLNFKLCLFHNFVTFACHCPQVCISWNLCVVCRLPMLLF